MSIWRSGSGLRVIELGSGISAAHGARLLADFGAEVIKVEPPVLGDASRAIGPFPRNVPDPERSGMYLYLNVNKRGITLDLAQPDGVRLFARLIADADALIENLGAGELDRLTAAITLPQQLVVCSISPYGQDGPKAAYLGSEISAAAAGGMMGMTGIADHGPVKQGLHQASHLAGVNAAAATLAASLLARRTGRGQRIDVSEQEVVALTVFPALNVYTHTGGVVKRAPRTLPRVATSQAMRAADGWAMPSDAGIDVWWEAFAGFVERPQLLDAPFSSRDTRHQHDSEIDEIVGPAFAARTKADLFHNGQKFGLTISSIQTPAEIAACPQLEARGFFVEQQHPVAGSLRMPGMVPQTCGVIPRVPRRSAPTLGQHNEEILSALDERAGRIASARDTARGALPLTGVRILELGMVFVLPLAITPLAALGADVIKVEAAPRPDSVRSGPLPGNVARPSSYNHAGNFHMLNRNKRGITLDLTKPGARDLLLRLVAVSDVVAENFTPRVLRNLGLSYERLREVNPRIILLSSTGFGQSGPWQNYKAYGPITESVDGLMHLTGYPDDPPTRAGAGGFGVAYTDVAGAYYGTYAILAALEHRERTGEGMWLDLSHYEAGVALLPEAMLDFEMNRNEQERCGNRTPLRAPQGAYPCAGSGGALDAGHGATVQPIDWHGASQTSPPGSGGGAPESLPDQVERGRGGSAPEGVADWGLGQRPERASQTSNAASQTLDDEWIAISIATYEQFRTLVAELDLPINASAYATLAARQADHDVLDHMIAAATRGRDARRLEARLQSAGVEATYVASPRDVWLDPQLAARGFGEVVAAPPYAPQVGPRVFPRAAWRMSHTPAGTRMPAPAFGEHTREVLREYLGVTTAELDTLAAEGAIADRPLDGLVPGRPLDLEGILAADRFSAIDRDVQTRLLQRFDGA
jgi:crotonobetainyl-CoA:carnitine CoA-transferase CaiB-like acyl-CoA transferase